MLPADDHTHSEWSWDAAAGSMEGSCRRAVELGLPSIAFTEHVDLVRWVLPQEERAQWIARRPHRAAWFGEDGSLGLPPLDVAGYLNGIERCRQRFPELRILTGVELGEPHWFAEGSRQVLAGGHFQRVLGSLHSLEIDGACWIVDALFRHMPESLTPADIVRLYLGELLRMVQASGAWEVLTHIDYPIRGWPAATTAFEPAAFEGEFRTVLGALARSDRVLEINTRLPLHPTIVRWWHEAGGAAVSFGSDAHLPEAVAGGFVEAAQIAAAAGFRPGRSLHDFWVRTP